MVGNEGFEPPMPDSESGALPLGEFPICETDCIERFIFCKFILIQYK